MPRRREGYAIRASRLTSGSRTNARQNRKQDGHHHQFEQIDQSDHRDCRHHDLRYGSGLDRGLRELLRLLPWLWRWTLRQLLRWSCLVVLGRNGEIEVSAADWKHRVAGGDSRLVSSTGMVIGTALDPDGMYGDPLFDGRLYLTSLADRNKLLRDRLSQTASMLREIHSSKFSEPSAQRFPAIQDCDEVKLMKRNSIRALIAQLVLLSSHESGLGPAGHRYQPISVARRTIPKSTSGTGTSRSPPQTSRKKLQPIASLPSRFGARW